ncbi:MAG: NAD-dependent epimerase/dehydratase family protein [Verrucomicrobiaceae bacterium]|nr:NAD-dependent epimerase/dehydratase family protein [Verrucomicrobiaceae bacterium]
MKTVIITGSCGLVGSDAALRLHAEGWRIVGIDNDMRRYFFGDDASTNPQRLRLEKALANYHHHSLDIRDMTAVEKVFTTYAGDIGAVIHTAAQPSHDWAVREPLTDFGVNATGTLHLLEATRKHAKDVPFIFTSTSKVYGDTPNTLPLVELETRWDIAESHPFHARGIDETMSIDGCLHSIFGASKVAADVMVQEYGRYFGMKTSCFRPGCLTGPAHAGAELHGFLAWLMKCTATGRPYTVFGYKGKQVRDNIHSADLIDAFVHFIAAPTSGQVYNIGASREAACSMIEGIQLCEEISGQKLAWTYKDENRIGDHIWWIGSPAKFEAHYPAWKRRYGLREILTEIHDACVAEK